jgi:hypothetical protein
MKRSKVLLPVLVLIFASLASACGSSSDSEASAIAKITPTETIFTLDDLLAVQFKKGKTFDVEGLTNATDAYLGFWGTDPTDRKEFEARFYASHSDAVEFGTFFAEERTGPDAVIKSGEATWEEGAKEARACLGASGTGGSNCGVSKYGDYIIYGNLILVCEGNDSPTALKLCRALLNQLEAAPARG